MYGDIDLLLGSGLGLAALAGVLVGARTAHALPIRRLQHIVAAALLAVGMLILWRAADRHF